MPGFRLERVTFDHPDAVLLRDEHVALGNLLYADDPAAVHRGGSEGIDPASVVATFVAYDGAVPIGHACVRRLDGAMAGDMEMKRLYVREASRGSGVADDLLLAIEQVVRDEGLPRVVIHTGDRQHAALTFYGRRGYTPIEVFAPYEAVTYSLCFEKVFA
ncbi:GNAT family N-acetyltransferase [Aeromicrobium stalagmiti]|uniref:GNAT family N-acetyltransferase n=1 Tax=Aeromicrobium stalagmiti TaxID=2738988 RepID=UPI00156A38A4|nr:GNAT family N-acetyltransferase [Aeromicrobium stalagmiti]NRQ49780.1 GNAT family N-acetyltransferase [Aeromicrobium stalagmiti]